MARQNGCVVVVECKQYERQRSFKGTKSRADRSQRRMALPASKESAAQREELQEETSRCCHITEVSQVCVRNPVDHLDIRRGEA